MMLLPAENGFSGFPSIVPEVLAVEGCFECRENDRSSARFLKIFNPVTT